MAPTQQPLPSTQSDLVATFASFLTIAIHTILHARNLYPPATFLTARAYNFPVHQSRHPAVCAWVSSAVAAVQAELLACNVDRVALVIYDPDPEDESPGEVKILERYVFDTSRLPVVPWEERDTTFAPTPAPGTTAVVGNEREKQSELKMVDIEEQLRGSLFKLSTLHTRLAPIPAGCSFTLAIELKDGQDPPVGHPQPWIPSQPSLQRIKGDDGKQGENQRMGRDLGGTRTTPIRAVEAGEMVFEMWVEEGRAKVDRRAKVESDDGSDDIDP